jgi:prepilin peptidase CpaA
MLHSLVLIAAATALLFAAAHDVAVRTVPNLVSLIVAIAGLGLNTWDGRLPQTLFGGVLVFTVAWYCWRRNWIGGGDVKLLAACAFLVPPASLPEFMLSTAIAGGLLALFYLGLARLLPDSAPSSRANRASLIPRILRVERRRIRRGQSLPYCCAITAGVLLTLYVPYG